MYMLLYTKLIIPQGKATPHQTNKICIPQNLVFSSKVLYFDLLMVSKRENMKLKLIKLYIKLAGSKKINKYKISFKHYILEKY